MTAPNSPSRTTTGHTASTATANTIAANASQVLVLTGMHRSGTSLTAQYLNQCGLSLGQDMLHLDKSNSEGSFLGHHEDMNFLIFHMNVLKRHRKDPSGYFIANKRSPFQSASKLPIRLQRSEMVEAQALLSSRNYLDQWGWKDPRTVLFLDFWQKNIPQAKFLFLFRHPLSVADSLVRKSKNPIIFKDPENAVRIWTVYNQEILKFLKKHRHQSLLWEIDHLVQSSDLFLEAINTQLNLKIMPISIKTILTQKAFHTSYSDDIKAIDNDYPVVISKALDIYEQLQAQAG
jgi:hypothetical protein